MDPASLLSLFDRQLVSNASPKGVCLIESWFYNYKIKSRQKCLFLILKRYLNPFKETLTTKSKCLIGLFGGVLTFAKGKKTYEIAELWIECKRAKCTFINNATKKICKQQKSDI